MIEQPAGPGHKGQVPILERQEEATAADPEIGENPGDLRPKGYRRAEQLAARKDRLEDTGAWISSELDMHAFDPKLLQDSETARKIRQLAESLGGAAGGALAVSNENPAYDYVWARFIADGPRSEFDKLRTITLDGSPIYEPVRGDDPEGWEHAETRLADGRPEGLRKLQDCALLRIRKDKHRLYYQAVALKQRASERSISVDAAIAQIERVPGSRARLMTDEEIEMAAGFQAAVSQNIDRRLRSGEPIGTLEPGK